MLGKDVQELRRAQSRRKRVDETRTGGEIGEKAVRWRDSWTCSKALDIVSSALMRIKWTHVDEVGAERPRSTRDEGDQVRQRYQVPF